MPPGSANAFSSVMKTAISVGMVASPIISCTYPALALFFLNRPRVREWAARPR
jgi:amino acid permease